MFQPTVIPAPTRWDEPFGPDMTDESVASVLSVSPLDRIDPEGFSAPLTLHAIVKNDSRLLEVNTGAIILREGDFGTSVFIVLEGAVRVVLGSGGLAEEAGDGDRTGRRGPLSALAQLWRNHRFSEVRDLSIDPTETKVDFDASDDSQQRLYFKDVEKTLERYPSATKLGPGSMFGEASALERSPRTATVFSEGPTRLLEIRWQGFRDIIRRNPELREHVDQLYRQRTLKNHLRVSPLFQHLNESDLDAVAAKTLFEGYGDYDWHIGFKRQGDHPGDSLKSEPLIAEEGHYADGLIILCAGFGRTSVRVDHGHHTLSYLKPGDTFGSEEIIYNRSRPDEAPLPLQSSLRAIGYAHVLRVPTTVFEKYVLDRAGAVDLPDASAPAPGLVETLKKNDAAGLDQATLEFLVERRFINGTATMLIDLDRCTRCDDCVRACAAGHDNNPRFVRHGPVFDHFMVANACMHCSDPVCMIGCPTGAIHRRTDEGQVTINDATCIGCGTCANSCPYDNIRMVGIRDDQNTMVLNQKTFAPVLKATKCDLCAEQMEAVAPACENACPHDALIRVDMRDKTKLATWLNR